MNRYFYDMHLHSCLSPCGDNDMTPNNIVNMGLISSLDIIALTDHNSCKNCPAAMTVAKKCGITLICGMELCTSEEIHVICLFDTLENAMDFDSYVEKHIPDIKNNEQIFGQQLILDSNDNITAHYDKLLVTATDISVTDVTKLCDDFHGACYPAHIDKSSYSLLSQLGDIPSECGFTSYEISARGDVAHLKEQFNVLNNAPLLLSSDAHYLEDIFPKRAWLELDDKTPESVIYAIKNGCKFGRG